MTKHAVFTVLALAAGCSQKSDRAAAAGDEAAPAPQAPAGASARPSVDLATAANAKLPPDATKLVTFETREIAMRQGTAVIAVPVGWSGDRDFPGMLAPPAGGTDLGLGTSVDVGFDCAGACEPKDWQAIIAKAAPNAVPDGPNTHTETLPDHGMIRWGSAGDSAYVYAAWYADGASNYRRCSARLRNAALVPAVDAFARACRDARIASR